MSAVCLIEGRQTDQPMNATLTLEVTVGERTPDLYCGALYSGLLTFGKIKDFGVILVTLSPAQIHTEQHIGPILRLSAASSGMDSQHRGSTIVWTAKLKLE